MNNWREKFDEEFIVSGDEWNYLPTKDAFQVPDPDEIKDFIDKTVNETEKKYIKMIGEIRLDGKLLGDILREAITQDNNK